MQSFLTAIIPALLPLLTIVGLICFFAYVWRVCFPRFQAGSAAWVKTVAKKHGKPPRTLTFSVPCHPLAKKDVLPMLLLTAVYACTAFFRLGSFTSPQSFQDLNGHTQEIVLAQDVYLTKLMYFPGLGTGEYLLEVSPDNQTWFTLWDRTDEEGNSDGYYWANAEGYAPHYALPQHYADLFKWIVVEPENPQYIRAIRLTGQTTQSVLELGELALYDEQGQRVAPDIQSITQDGQTLDATGLFDEQDTVPASSEWYNSTYFDEIYHARTALEHIRGIYPYELSHPPLGKLILGLGIHLFGMTPFGWRFMGTLFGVLMIPLLYLFLTNLFGKRLVSICGTALLACDFMHLTQTRIATIDTYGVFFILLMYYFLYRWLVLPAGTPWRKGAPWLLLSGLAWGLGAASKWTVIYGGVGLALLYFIGLYCKLRDWPQKKEDRPLPVKPWIVKTLAFSVLCFVVLPGIIYLLSYLPYAYAQGDMSLGSLWKAMWDNQLYMFNYHKGVHDSHPYSSRWYQWLVDARPILYYLDSSSVPGFKTAFGAFANPIVCWGGLIALVFTAVQMILRRCGKALFIVIGFLSQFIPWIIIGRTTFAYHYFPSLIFLILALAYVFNLLLDAQAKHGRQAVCAVAGASAALYVLFYPVLIGLSIPVWYSSNLLRWFPSWPF